MVVEEVVNVSANVLSNTILEIGKVALWLQALGVIIVLWIIFQIILIINDRKKRKVIYSMKKDIIRIEKKLDKLSKKN
jgi:membrane protein YdbS with pleckstrin-like domain|tara:strand:- start:357 stop:590 length:234 start_codon:yes stop_codon:yes gene_type:complete